MVDEHGIAIEEILARVQHAARRRGAHRRAGRRGDVHAAVRIAGLAVEDAPQPEELERRPGSGARRRSEGGAASL
ncbi:MAG: hypothetical protein U1F11_10090 [Steroidobacteraceae bacterium]